MKKLNKKGFTLVELLAVIVILALLMVVAVSTVGNVQENAKKNALKTEAQKIVNAAYQEAQSALMLNSGDLSANSSLKSDGHEGYYYKGEDGKYKYYIMISSAAKITNVCVDDGSRYQISTEVTQPSTIPENVKIDDIQDSYATDACQA